MLPDGINHCADRLTCRVAYLILNRVTTIIGGTTVGSEIT